VGLVHFPTSVTLRRLRVRVGLKVRVRVKVRLGLDLGLGSVRVRVRVRVTEVRKWITPKLLLCVNHDIDEQTKKSLGNLTRSFKLSML